MNRNRNYFSIQKNVDAYLRMLEGYDTCCFMTDLLYSLLPAGSTVLELGIGPGKDLQLLNRDYTVTGSDNSPIFLELFRKHHADADLLLLDAVTLDTERLFDCIFSNKVLMHLEKEEMFRSFQRQKEVLNQGGLLLHSFWYGERQEEFDGLFFQYYTEKTLEAAIADAGLRVVRSGRYAEEEEGDSLFAVAALD